MRISAYIFSLLALLVTESPGHAGNLSDITQQTMSEVVKVAQAISVVQPKLDEAKYIEYALGIHRAARRYEIDPYILISIAQQETGFRENLPEGAAGEHGICQIRKAWLKTKQFKEEFDRPSLKDLKHPAKNFMMAAYILKDLKETVKSKTLPFWSYYNARKFENRFKYFLLVNRNIAALHRFDTSKTKDAAPAPVAVAAERSTGGSSSAPAADPLAGARTVASPALNAEERKPAPTETPSSLAEITRNTYWTPDLRASRPSERSIAD